MPRYLSPFLAVALLAGHAWAQQSSQDPTSASAGMHHCEDTVTTGCLVGEIRSYLASDIDPFKRERAMLALAQAQLADGSVEQALVSYGELEAKPARAEFLVSHAKRLIADGDSGQALERLREADALLTEGQRDLDRLNVTRQSQLIAETFAQAGAAEEGRAILDGIASYRDRIPMNPMLLALMLEIGKAQAEIGFPEEAARLVRETYDLALDQDVQVMPEQMLFLFEVWASIDAAAATEAAEDFATAVGEDDPAAFVFAVWTGLSSGLAASGEDSAAFIESARKALADAPGRAEALRLAPKLADAMREAGNDEQALAFLSEAHTEAAALSSTMERAHALLALAEGFGRADAPDKAAEILRELLAMTDDTDAGKLMLRQFASIIPAQFAVLGKVDEAYDLAMKDDDASREMVMVMAADRLATQGDYLQALRFLRGVESEIAVMMMAGMADRIAYPQD